MTLVVQKYGGTSIAGTAQIKQVAKRIIASRHEPTHVVVVVSAMGQTTEKLLALAHGISDNPDARELDLLLSTGEMVSCSLLALALKARGCPAVSLTGLHAGIRTDDTYGRAHISGIDPRRIQQELNQDQVVIVAGFQGFTKDMNITTLGRGGSDITAVALAATLAADRCEIYTDVQGIYTADPRYVTNARKLDEIGYEEMLELASYGAKMHPRSIELGMVYRVPIYVASASDATPGTLIHGGITMMEKRKKVTGIACDLDVAKITIRRVPDQPGVAAKLFEALTKKAINVDTIVQNVSIDGETDLSFTVTRSDLRSCLSLLECVSRDIGAQGVTSDATLSKISIVGAGMQNAPGFASRMFRSLANASINIEMITTSEIRITCIISEHQVARAASALHQAFDLETES